MKAPEAGRDTRVAGFDLVRLGVPKWLYLSYPVTRWPITVSGLKESRGRLQRPFRAAAAGVRDRLLFEPMEAILRATGRRIKPAGQAAEREPAHLMG